MTNTVGPETDDKCGDGERWRGGSRNKGAEQHKREIKEKERETLRQDNEQLQRP